MRPLIRGVISRPWWVIVAWLLLAVAGGFAAPHATSALSYDFGLPDRPGFIANQKILQTYGSGGANAPVLLVVGDGRRDLPPPAAAQAAQQISAAAGPLRARVATYEQAPDLMSKDRRTGVVLVYPAPVPGPEPYARALPALRQAAEKIQAQTGLPVTVTGQDALATEGGGGGPSVLVETIAGGLGALIVLALVFGSLLALTPLFIAAASILTTFLIVWGLTEFTEVSFIVQYLLALIGLGVAIDYALLIVTRWREERANGLENAAAVERALSTAGRSVLFSGVTVAVSLAALILLPVPFLRSVGFTGLLIPLLSVLAALTLLPALLVVAGPRLSWPNRRSGQPDSPLWRRIGNGVVRHRWASIAVTVVVLLALAAPLLTLRLGQPSNDSLASTGGRAGQAVRQIEQAGLGAGLTQPVEITTDRPDQLRRSVAGIEGVAGVLSPPDWSRGGGTVVEAWTSQDPSTSEGADAAARVRDAVRATGAEVGGIPAQNADFIDAVYGNAWWIIGLIVIVTMLLLTRALRSVVLPLKALVLNVISLGAAYGVTVLIWQHGVGTEALFGQSGSDAITVWVPIAVFAFLFGLSMDYEVFLLARIKEEHDAGLGTDKATVAGIARTGRLVTSAALILFLSFVSLAQVPSTDVKILATALALGIVIDATLIRGILAPALVAALGPANWWRPKLSRARRARSNVE
ncbi:MMPL family transporter [Actinomadura barringtoniae]|uniref:MMPL family transporter n=1 Tax=Actinomadura barringtoniae TaxID=1427535 RepID=A0A939PQ09_9ACTN|nr:MMPL family transporter [Actinomadura barringtoniae]MBO2453094.1 MMPL family transporter [Actinomadura barringtoniae]